MSECFYLQPLSYSIFAGRAASSTAATNTSPSSSPHANCDTRGEVPRAAKLVLESLIDQTCDDDYRHRVFLLFVLHPGLSGFKKAVIRFGVLGDPHIQQERFTSGTHGYAEPLSIYSSQHTLLSTILSTGQSNFSVSFSQPLNSSYSRRIARIGPDQISVSIHTTTSNRPNGQETNVRF